MTQILHANDTFGVTLAIEKALNEHFAIKTTLAAHKTLLTLLTKKRHHHRYVVVTATHFRLSINAIINAGAPPSLHPYSRTTKAIKHNELCFSGSIRFSRAAPPRPNQRHTQITIYIYILHPSPYRVYAVYAWWCATAAANHHFAEQCVCDNFTTRHATHIY